MKKIIVCLCAVCIVVPLFAAASSAAMNDEDFISLCELGTSKEVEAAIKAGANVNAKRGIGWTALMQAALFGKPEVISLLLEAGAAVNAKDNLGETPLIAAAGGGDNTEAISLLLGAGADVNAKKNDGDTALMTVARSGAAEAVSLLLKAGADIDAIDNDGRTALMAVALAGSPYDTAEDRKQKLECFLLLLDNGANPDLTNPKSTEAIDGMLQSLSDEEREMVRARLAGKAGGNVSAADGSESQTVEKFADVVKKEGGYGDKEVGKRFLFVGEGSNVTINPDIYGIQDYAGPYFSVKEAQKNGATPDFMQCIDNGNYKGNIEISAIVRGFPEGMPELVIDTISTCRRI